MKKIFLLITPVIFCLSATNTGAQTGAPAKSKPGIALITAVTAKGKDFIIDADFVQMLTGKAAVKAAKKAGEAEYDIDKNKDTLWYVPNDFFVLNSNPAVRRFYVATDAKIYFLKTAGSAHVKSSIAKLKNNFADKLFRLTLVKNEIVKLEELYTP